MSAITAVVCMIALTIALLRLEYIFYLLLMILLIIPAEEYIFDPIPFGYNLKMLYIIITFIIVFLSFEILSGRRPIQDVGMKFPMLLFLSFVIFSAFIGYAYGNDTEVIKTEILTILPYGIFFFIPTIINTRKLFSTMVKIMIVGACIVAIEYYAIFLYQFVSGGFQRINPNQGQIFLFSLPLIAGIIIKMVIPKWAKILLAVVLIMCFGAIAITFTRGLWICCAIGLFVMVLLFRRDIDKKMFIIISACIGIGGVLILYALAARTGIDVWNLVIKRATTFFEFQNIITIQQRFTQSKIVIGYILQRPFFGSGLGSQFYSSQIGAVGRVTWIDNSYLSLIWKLGIIGTGPLLLIYIKSLIDAIKIFKNTKDQLYKVYSGAFIPFVIAFLILATMSPLMIKYALNIVWAIILASISCINNFRNESSNTNF